MTRFYFPQGIDPDLKPIMDPSAYPVVVHGTYSKAWQQIRHQGLSKMRRNHIHFAQGKPVLLCGIFLQKPLFRDVL